MSAWGTGTVSGLLIWMLLKALPVIAVGGIIAWTWLTPAGRERAGRSHMPVWLLHAGLVGGWVAGWMYAGEPSSLQGFSITAIAVAVIVGVVGWAREKLTKSETPQRTSA